MESEIEILSPTDALREQIAINQAQLGRLKRLESEENLKISLLLPLLGLLAGAIIFFCYVVVSDPSHLPLRSELHDLSGIILVFLIFGLIKTAAAISSAGGRRREISYLREMQERAIHFAGDVLNPESPTR
jgi:membrane-associated HD superfamily phosphohydrolase